MITQDSTEDHQAKKMSHIYICRKKICFISKCFTNTNVKVTFATDSTLSKQCNPQHTIKEERRNVQVKMW
jgi:hypothetical protein